MNAEQNPFAGGSGMRASNAEHATAPSTGVPTIAGENIDVVPGEDGCAYMNLGLIKGNPLLHKLCHGGLTKADLPKNRDGTQRDRTGIVAVRRNIYEFLTKDQQAIAMARLKKQSWFREGMTPNVWAGDTLITLDTGVAARAHLLIELVEDTRQTAAAETPEGGGDATEDSIDKALAGGVQS